MTQHRRFDQPPCRVPASTRARPPGRFLFCLLLISLSGCLQEDPAPSAERTAAILTALLHDEDAAVRRTAAESLGKIGDRAAARAVLPLLTDPAPSVRAAAATALGRMGPPPPDEVVIGLIRALEDPEESVTGAAALAIGELEPDSEQLGAAVNLVRASDVRVRRAAIRGLLQAEGSLWGAALVAALGDTDAEVRQSAVAALGMSGDPAAAAAIRKRLADDRSPAVRAEAAYQMGTMDTPETRVSLEDAAARDPDSGVRRWAEAGLRSLRGSE